jgi:hypothetical protein
MNLPQPISTHPVEKGKMRDTAVVGLTPNPPPAPPFCLPSINIACRTTAELWPKRISPNHELILPPYEKSFPIPMLLTTESGETLGTLLLNLVEWMILPPVIDLTTQRSGNSSFQAPDGTTVSPTDNETPRDVLALIAENATYSMYVQSSQISIHLQQHLSMCCIFL